MREVRATKNNLVGTSSKNRFYALFYGIHHFVNFFEWFRDAIDSNILLDQQNKFIGYCRNNRDILRESSLRLVIKATVECALRREDTYYTRRRRKRSRFYCGLNTYKRNIRPFAPQCINSCGSGSIAGDNDNFAIMLFN